MRTLPFILTVLFLSIVTLSLTVVAIAFYGFQAVDQVGQAIETKIEKELEQLNAPPPVDEQMLTLPNSDQGGPWPIGAYAKSNSPIRGVELAGHLPKKHRFIGVTVSEQNGLAIVTFTDNSVRGVHDTYALTVDLARGQVQSKWSVPDFAQPISINSDGTQVLFWRNDGIASGREMLYVGQRKSTDDDFELSDWQPMKKEGTKPGNYDKSIRLKWASFVGQQVVTVNEQGRLQVYGEVNGQALKWIAGVEGFPSLTPDRKKIVFVVNQNVLLFDPNELAITHALTVDELPQHAILSVDPLANKLLIAGMGRAIVVKLDDLTCDDVQIEKLAIKKQRAIPDLAWFGESLFFYKNQLFDFESPMPVWNFRSGDQLQLVGESLWGVAKSGGIGSPDKKLQRFSLNAKSIHSEIREAYRTSDVAPFRAGHTDLGRLSSNQPTSRRSTKASPARSPSSASRTPKKATNSVGSPNEVVNPFVK